MKNNRLKTLLINECAKLMYHEGVTQYFDAKKIAAKRICRNQRALFPSNREISLAVQAIAESDTSFDQQNELYKMRRKAIDFMCLLSQFQPRLIGSVSTGRIRRGSDIDLHVFVDEIEILRTYLNDSDILFEENEVMISKNGKRRNYQHIYIRNEFDIELSVYPLDELKVQSRSSTDGKPIQRLTMSKVERLIEQEHWRDFEKD